MVKAAKQKTMTFVIDCSKPCEDNIMQIDVFMKYLSDRIKVNGKAGLLVFPPGGAPGGGRLLRGVAPASPN